MVRVIRIAFSGRRTRTSGPTPRTPPPSRLADQAASWIPQAWPACQAEILSRSRSAGTPSLHGRRLARRAMRRRPNRPYGSLLNPPRKNVDQPGLRRERCGRSVRLRGPQAEVGEDLLCLPPARACPHADR